MEYFPLPVSVSAYTQPRLFLDANNINNVWIKLINGQEISGLFWTQTV